MFRSLSLIVSLVLIIGLSSCSKFNKLLKNDDHEYKYERAVEYFDKGDFYHALQLFDQIMPVFKGTDKAERLNYFYAQSYYQQEDFIMASYYFKKFAKEFPRSEHADEAAFLSAYCKYKESPKYSLDQTNTMDAIKELQVFLNIHSESKFSAQCNDLIDELRAKLEKKEFEIANLYLKMSDYRAAITSYSGLLKNYPDTEYKELAMFRLIKANYIYASKSIPEKQSERYQLAVEAYDSFIVYFAQSELAADATDMYEKSRKQLSLLSK
ncbi:MAG: outer membrane protein assembly factor BamD [Bacteroidales bacterium]|nr:outer membrane protein assembly factor BamD [Bacteroidales bacterium]